MMIELSREEVIEMFVEKAETHTQEWKDLLEGRSNKELKHLMYLVLEELDLDVYSVRLHIYSRSDLEKKVEKFARRGNDGRS